MNCTKGMKVRLNRNSWISEKYVSSLTLPFNITFKNKYEHQAVQQFLFDNGCKWFLTGDKAIKNYGDNSMLVGNDKGIANHSSRKIPEDFKQYPTYTIADLEIMAEILNPKKPVTEFELNDEYTAIINPNDNTVKVGSQVFSFETVKELASKL